MGGLASQSQTLDGWWLSGSGGSLFEVTGAAVRAFEVTSISCLPTWHVTGRADATIGAINFMQDDGKRHLALDSKSATARLQSDDSVADVLFRKLPGPPKTFREAPGNTPQANYAVFWQTFAENYPFFELHHVDWTAVDREFRPKISAKTTNEDLFRILRKMIEPLQDAHTSLNAPDLRQQFKGCRPGSAQMQYDDWVQSAVIVGSKYLRGEMRNFCNNQLNFGMLEGSIGYLKIWSFAKYADAPEYSRQLQAMEAALDVIFHDSEKLQGLVIDVRLNTGGYDGLGLGIASHLASQDYVAYSVEARENTPGAVRFTPPQAVQIHAGSRPGFHGNVVLLIGRDCVSAGETFAMALMNRKPVVTRIGENTQGVFSDVLTRRLPNGWRFGLPNEIYLTSEGKSFDGSGVPPDVSVPVFPREDLRNKHDTALEKAVQVLRGQAR